LALNAARKPSSPTADFSILPHFGMDFLWENGCVSCGDLLLDITNRKFCVSVLMGTTLVTGLLFQIIPWGGDFFIVSNSSEGAWRGIWQRPKELILVDVEIDLSSNCVIHSLFFFQNQNACAPTPSYSLQLLSMQPSSTHCRK
jgi:hypothetical protein